MKNFIYYIFLLFLIFWIIGFFIFSTSIAFFKYHTTQKADVIFVLTGGNGRLDRAFALLKEQQAPLLFISGVNDHTTLSDLNPPEEIKNQVILGKKAKNTKENALEVKNYVEDNQIKKAILVTSYYHMHRSLLEVKHLCPQVNFIPYPILTLQSNGHFFTSSKFFIVFKEYNKYIYAWLRIFGEGFIK